MNTRDVVDRFVQVISSAGVPFTPVNNAPWIERLEEKLPARLPASFRSLVTRYSFPAFEVSSLSLFANNGDDEEEELSKAIFKDKIMAEVTHDAGYIQFARPADGSYDPVCFNTNERSNNRECPIVRLDHEQILMKSRLVVRDTIAKSFFAFAQAIIEPEKDQHGRIISVSKRTDF